MEITKEVIESLDILTEQLGKVQDELTERVNNVKMYKGDVEHELERGGKKVWVKEILLWDEVYELGIKSQAGTILMKKYPEIDDLIKAQDRITNDYSLYVKSNLRMDINQMKISDFIKLMLALIEYKNGDGKTENSGETTSPEIETTDSKGTDTAEQGS